MLCGFDSMLLWMMLVTLLHLGLECLRAASTTAVMNATAWTAYPGWGGDGVSGFPIPGFSWGNLAIVDGHIIPKPPVESLASAENPSVPLIIGTTAQETDIFPLIDVRNYSWTKYNDLARRKMKPFGEAVVNSTFKLYPNVVDPEYQYTLVILNHAAPHNKGPGYPQFISHVTQPVRLYPDVICVNGKCEASLEFNML